MSERQYRCFWQYGRIDKSVHDKKLKTGVLLTNLGTPDAPTPKALKRYLKEFLSDNKIVKSLTKNL